MTCHMHHTKYPEPANGGDPTQLIWCPNVGEWMTRQVHQERFAPGERPWGDKTDARASYGREASGENAHRHRRIVASSDTEVPKGETITLQEYRSNLGGYVTNMASAAVKLRKARDGNLGVTLNADEVKALCEGLQYLAEGQK